MHEHEVDAGVPGGDLRELGDQEGVAGYVDSVGGGEGGGGCGVGVGVGVGVGGRGGGEVAEFEEPAVCGGDLGLGGFV